MTAHRDRPRPGRRGIEEGAQRHGADVERDVCEETLPDLLPARMAALPVFRMTAAASWVGTPAIAEIAEGPHLVARPVIL